MTWRNWLGAALMAGAIGLIGTAVPIEFDATAPDAVPLAIASLHLSLVSGALLIAGAILLRH